MEVVEAIVLTSTLALSKRLYLNLQTEVLSEGKLVDINKESGCKENDEGVSEDAGKILHIKGNFTDIFLHWKHRE